MHQTQWIRAYLFVLLIYELPELSLCATVADSKVKHEGFCPNKLNSNLWVDAQSTCERECNVDEVVISITSIIGAQFILHSVLFKLSVSRASVCTGLRRL